MILYAATVVIGMILLIIFLVMRAKGPGLGETAMKSLVSVFFLLTAFAAALNEGEHLLFALLICGGLILGLLGDIWLDLRNVYLRDQMYWTKLGFAVFFVGHLFYISAVISLCGVRPGALLAGIVAAVIAIVFVLLGEKPMHLQYGSLRGISTAYGALLFFMTVFTLGNALLGRNVGLAVMGIGGLLFLLSDLILSGTYFGVGKDRPVHIVSNHLLYYLGQYMIASGILWIGMTW